jgi:NADH:ubiquinone oxidoreductase subunit 6 (subunit J)
MDNFTIAVLAGSAIVVLVFVVMMILDKKNPETKA